MWALGFVSRLPSVAAPSWLVAIGMVVCLVGAGARAGRLPGLGIGAGALTGLVVSLVNLLVLGSLLGGDQPNRLIPSAALWLPGSILFGVLAGALGAVIGRPLFGAPSSAPDWTAALARVAALATLCLVAIGGLVTSHEAGLAVVDWPNSYGYGMFLYPLSRMVGGIYYEHAHRLFGTLVGLTTLVLAGRLFVAEPRRGVQWMGVAAVVLVIAQGILGGLRVTGHFTLSDSPELTRPNLTLAMVHGVVGQLFLGLMTALAGITSRLGREGLPGPAPPGASTDRFLGAVLLVLILVQLILGVRVRHTGEGVLLHVTGATVVIALITAIGIRALGGTERPPVSRISGSVLLGVGWLQVILGMGALSVTAFRAQTGAPPTSEIVVATAHQTVGAVLLGVAVLHHLLWTRITAQTAPTPAQAPL
jgi:cytochrome c oxidase assembly protein subunit 15